MKLIERSLLSAVVVLSCSVLAIGQAPAGRQGAGRGGPRGPVFSVTTTAWPDGGEVPMKYSMRGDNKCPPFEFHWSAGANAADPPADLKTYVVILHDMEIGMNKGPMDGLHWAAFNIPGTAKGLPEGMPGGDLPDGTRNGPGFAAGRGGPPAYFGPGAGPGPIHHYAFEFYAMDTKLDLPANVSREDLLKAMEGHVIGKATYFGRFHAAQ